MIKNFQELVSQIKSQVPIQDLISEYITVKKSGRGYVALCPFHDDHHPSLQIHSQKGIFKCFSCGTGGDLITFYALINKKKWSEVIPELAIKYGLKIEYGEESKTEIQIKSQLYDLNKTVLEYFKANLYHSSNIESLSYLKTKRKISEEIINKYQLGFAIKSWDSVYNYLTKEKQYNQELIIASGLFVPKENSKGYYDRFRNRIMFPIFDEKNNVIGFGGRTLSDDEVKYINSPETLIFSKGHTLYGLNFAKDEIIKQNYVIVTEGYLDVITSHQNGLLNTVATLGTALTIQQARLLTKYTNSKKVFLCLDSDSAGHKAVESIFRLSQEIGQYINWDLRVASDLGAKDLDEALNTNGYLNVKDKIENSQKLISFIFERMISSYLNADSDISKKSILDEIIEIIIAIKDPLERNDYTKHLAQKLRLEEEIFNLIIKEKSRNKKSKKSYEVSRKDKTEDDLFKMHTKERFKHAELEILCLYISSFPNFADEITNEIKQIEFIDEKH